MESNALYGSRADLYDLIYDGKDYAAEGERLHDLLTSLGVADGARVLEAACGTGSHLASLTRHYRAAGFDLSDEMLAIARGKVSGVELFRADMCDFTVEEPFDAVLCLFSSIGYATPESRLRDAARSFARALRPGGVVVIEPWLTPDVYLPGTAHLQTYLSDEVKLCRANVAKREGALAILDFQWLVARAGGGVEHFAESHALELYTVEQMLAALTSAGLETEHREEGIGAGRGLYIARR